MHSPARQAGTVLHIVSLPSDFGIGDLGRSAYQFVDALVAMQLSVWQFLPLGPTAYGDSPYQPLSSFAGNELLIDVENLVELGLLTPGDLELLREMPVDHVDYDALIPAKWPLLRLAASRFESQASADVRSEFQAFISTNDKQWLHDYACYRCLKSHHGERPWPEWQSGYARRETASMRKFESTSAAQIMQMKVIQFLFFRQWLALRRYANEQGIRMLGDMPIYIALDSADAWARRDLLLVDRDGRPERVAGVPPDYFSEDGQLWGNPLYDWQQHASSGYQWWVDRLRAALVFADTVRIDHFRGFEAFWSIPADADTARDGHWETGPGNELFDALQDALGDLPIIAEDLGVITPQVDQLRDDYGLPGMRILQFDVCDPDFELSQIGANTVCYTGTHDNDTTLGWYTGGGPTDNRDATEIRQAQDAALNVIGGRPETVHTDFIKAAFSTDAYLAIAPMQDYLGLGSEARINTPGIAGGNWRWRLQNTQLSPDFCDNVASMVTDSGRGF